MTQKETTLALATLRTAYPAFYSKVTKQEIEATVKLWSCIFASDDYGVVMIALMALISCHSGYPPDIAALRRQIDEMKTAASGDPTDEELWHFLQNAASNGTYGFREEFAKLPPILKRYVGSANTLREFAQMEETTFNTVVKGQFLKQIHSLRERERFDAQTPLEVKELLASNHKELPKADQTFFLGKENA